MIDLTTKYNQIRDHCVELEEKLADPAVMKDAKAYAQLNRSHRELAEVVRAFERRSKLVEDLAGAREMSRENDPEMAAMAQAEAESLAAELERAEYDLQILLLPADPRDGRNCIIEIRAGTGGDEAGLFARDLFTMYCRYAERRKWKVEILSDSPNDMGGFKEVIFLLTGERCFSRMKYEGGTHRVQRVPATETQGRIHTSAVTVAVMAEADDVEINIRSEDLRIDVFRAGGPGGQGVNTTDSAIRITHLPTGLVVSCQDERSQIKNKAKGLKVLQSRLLDLEEQKQHDAMSAERKAQVGTGDRSGRIRTYNFPQNRLTDHRINLTLYSLDRAMQGEIEEVLDALASHYQTEALKRL